MSLLNASHAHQYYVYLFSVVAERKQLSDSNHDFHTKLASLSANQTHLANNLSALTEKIDQFSLQVSEL